jgi:autotransporter-associated beta strand protein
MRSFLLTVLISCLSLTVVDGAERTWTGGGGASNPSWQLPINWGGMAPVAGDALRFPAASSKNGTNDFASGTAFGPLAFDAGGYVLSGAGVLDLKGGIFLNGSNTAQVVMPLSITSPTAFTVTNANGLLTIGQTISGTGAVIKSGSGALIFTGNHTYTGGTIIDNGLLQAGGNVTGIIQIRNGFLIGGGSVDGIRSLHQGAGDVAGVSPGTNGSAGTLTVDGDITLFNDDDLYFSLSSGTSDKLVVNGAVDLGGCGIHLDLLSAPALNTDITLIDNDGTDAVIYDVANPSNYLFNLTVGGVPYQLRMVGGTNYNDVVARRVAGNAFTMTLDSNDADDTINHGSSITFTAGIVGAVMGPILTSAPVPVSFWDGNQYLGTSNIGAVSPTSVTFTTSGLRPGLRKITAYFEGNANNAPVRSAIYQVSVQGTGTTTTLGASPTPTSTPGQLVTITASVTSNPSGTVVFFDNGAELDSATVSGGQAVITTSTLVAGTHALTATFVPNDGTVFMASTTSSPLSHTVSGTATSTTLNSSLTPAVAGSDVTLTATVSGATTGSVEFRDAGALLATVAVNGSSEAVLTTSGLAAGTHQLTAHYLGTIDFQPSTSAIFSQTITARPDGSSGGPVELEESGGCGLGGGVATLLIGLLMLVAVRLRRD